MFFNRRKNFLDQPNQKGIGWGKSSLDNQFEAKSLVPERLIQYSNTYIDLW